MRPPPLAIVAAACLVAAAIATVAAQRADPTPFPVFEADIATLQRAMQDGRTTSRAITAAYLARIERYEPTLNAVITVNPRALDEADALDRERRRGRVRGPLHGIPIALKDNIQTRDLPTTGGALAFARLRPPVDATVARQLRAAGAIILAKTSMTELANWVSSRMPPGYSAIAGFGVNPYDPRRNGPATAPDAPPVLSPGGSSSGIGTAASFWAANVGTETSGSILNPSSQTMLVGIKPTVGRVSRHGVIPISADQDTPGPMARSVADAAVMLDAMQPAAPDPDDPATSRCPPAARGGFRRHLTIDGLRGARIGIPRAFFYDPLRLRGAETGGLTPPQRAVMTQALEAIRMAGATIVDPADLPSIVADEPDRSLQAWPVCIGVANARDTVARCSIVLEYGMKRDFNRWLASLGKAAPVPSLTALRAWNRDHAAEGTLRFGQDQLDVSDRIDLDRDRSRYEADRRKDVALAATSGIDAAMTKHRLDALLFPAYFGSPVSARAGYPSVIVPFGLIPARLPLAGGSNEDARSLPFGVTFAGGACSEARLIELAYAFEQATRRRVPPKLE